MRRIKMNSNTASQPRVGRKALTNALAVGLAFTAAATFADNRADAGFVDMGAANTFAVLGASTVTNTGSSVIWGDVGVSPGTAITGFPPGIVQFGALHFNNAFAMQAQTDALAAFNQLAGMTVTSNLTGQDLGGLTLTPGVYFFSSSAQLTGTLTLDGMGQDNPLFVFLIGSTLTSASNASINMINGNFDTSNDVFWQVGSSATLGTGTNFIGTILANQSATLNTGASLEGRVIALNGAVTLDDNFIMNSRAIPGPGGLALMAAAALFGVRRRRA